MLSYIWPIALVIVSNVFYHICYKSRLKKIDTLAFLTVAYTTGAAVAAALYFILSRDGNLLREYAHLNWAPFVLGVVLVCLETGYIYVYKAGWQASAAVVVQSSFVSFALLFVGLLLYHERITWKKVIGIVICMVGLYFIKKK